MQGLKSGQDIKEKSTILCHDGNRLYFYNKVFHRKKNIYLYLIITSYLG